MKRKVHRRKTSHRKNSMKIKAVYAALAICISVGAGYITATYIIGPALGLDAKPMFSEFLNEKKDNVENNEEKEDNVKVVQDKLDVKSEQGYALQYGSFSEKKGAEKFAAELTSKGLNAEIINKDDGYKVIGEIFDTYEEAEKSKLQSSLKEDVFITEIP